MTAAPQPRGGCAACVGARPPARRRLRGVRRRQGPLPAHMSARDRADGDRAGGCVWGAMVGAAAAAATNCLRLRYRPATGLGSPSHPLQRPLFQDLKFPYV